jgi:hypothetical protein
MSNVNDYLKVMRKTGEKAAQTNPNSEFNQLKLELVEHYKTNKIKAEQLIKSVEIDNQSTQSAMHNLHYQAAVIAVRGYPQVEAIKPSNTFGPEPTNQVSELERLQQNGWAPLGAPKAVAKPLNYQLIKEG